MSEEISPLEGATSPDRSLRQKIAIAAISALVILMIYTYVSTRDRSLDIEHSALVSEQQENGLICCGIYYERAGSEYLLLVTRELEGEFRQVIMRVMRLDEDGRPEEVNAIGSPFDSLLPTSFSRVGDTAYVPLYGEDRAGVWTIDLLDPMRPEDAGVVETSSGFSRQLAASEDVVAINHTDEIVLLDISDPRQPEPVSNLEQQVSGSIQLRMQHSRLYVNDGDADLIRIVDVSDPSNPDEIGEHINPDGPGEMPFELGFEDAEDRLDAAAAPGRYLDLAVAGDLLYVAASDQGLQVIDVSDPRHSRLETSLGTPDRAIRVAIDEPAERLYLLGGSEGDIERLNYSVHIVDISSPDAPEILESIDGIVAEPGLQALATGGGYVFIGLDETLLVFDVSR